MKTIISVIEDDLDGSPNANRHTFVIDGWAYQIDLSDANFGALSAALRPFIDAARRVRGTHHAGGRAARSAPTRSTVVPAAASTIRAWWASNQTGLSPFRASGRIPDAVVAAFDRAHQRR